VAAGSDVHDDSGTFVATNDRKGPRNVAGDEMVIGVT